MKRLRQVDCRSRQLNVFFILFALLVIIVAKPLHSAQYLWLDNSVQPGHFHRAWFIGNGNPAGNIRLAGTTTLNAAITGLANGDIIYSVAHGICRKCNGVGSVIKGGLIALETNIPEGFAAGTDPGAKCAGDAPYAIPAKGGITWRMLTCYANKIPTWGGGAISVRKSADDRLPGTSTVTGPDVLQKFGMGFRVAYQAGEEADIAACLATFAAWVTANHPPHKNTTDWYDATAVGGHGANMAALNAGPVATYNTAHGTHLALTRNNYLYDPAIPGTLPPVPPRDGELDADTEDDIPICTTIDGAQGACCLPDIGCVDGLTSEECLAQSGYYMGDGTTCDMVQCPTLTQWGLIVLVVLIVFSTWVVLRRRKAVVSGQ